MKIHRIISGSVIFCKAMSATMNNAMQQQHSNVTINMEDDELEWDIEEYDSYDAELYEPGINLKSTDKHAGGIRVRNMGRIMKMAMFIQKKPAKNFIREFKRYGCHCWPKGRITLGGQGKPVDDVDRTCKRLFNCHRCLQITTEGKCNPNEFQYRVRGKDTDGERIIHCDGNAENTCQRSLCECDLAFARDLAREMDSESYSPSNSKWQGFNSNNECRAAEMLNARSKIQPKEYETPTELKTHNGWACCGENYKNFTPYKPSKGARCCNIGSSFQTYVLDKQDCCADGSVKMFGECA